jgi:hypothetical protein
VISLLQEEEASSLSNVRRYGTGRKIEELCFGGQNTLSVLSFDAEEARWSARRI